MYLLEEDIASAWAYIDAIDRIYACRLLDGFTVWVSERLNHHSSGAVWSQLITENMFSDSDYRGSLSGLQQKRVADKMFEFAADFIEESGRDKQIR